MKKAILISGFLGAIIGLLGAGGCAQRPVDYQKIDPILQAQLRNSTREADRTTRYPCIVYTKDPQSLQKTGVQPNSVFPTFVTAQLTKKQIFQLAGMPQVTYIASPKPDQPQLEGAGSHSSL